MRPKMGDQKHSDVSAEDSPSRNIGVNPRTILYNDSLTIWNCFQSVISSKLTRTKQLLSWCDHHSVPLKSSFSSGFIATSSSPSGCQNSSFYHQDTIFRRRVNNSSRVFWTLSHLDVLSDQSSIFPWLKMDRSLAQWTRVSLLQPLLKTPEKSIIEPWDSVGSRNTWFLRFFAERGQIRGSAAISWWKLLMCAQVAKCCRKLSDLR